MHATAVVLSLVLLLLALSQWVLALLFSLRTRATTPSEPIATEPPRAAVLLALRGADPGLAESLRRLATQNYPSYELHLVVDSQADPAWEIAAPLAEHSPGAPIRLAPLGERPPTCSLHCASLLQLTENLDDSFQAYALVDGDVVAHPTWLAELMAPLATGQAHATTGNRWYLPPHGRLGSLVRYVWNAAALLTMYWSHIPWGGALAGETQDLHASGIRERWRRALAVDAPLSATLRDIGIRPRFVPSLVMFNREECGLRGSFAFIARQLLWTRLYQPASFWWSSVVYTLLTSLLLLGTLVVFIVTLVMGWQTGEWIPLGWIILGSLGYLVAICGSLLAMETRMRAVARQRGESARWLSPTALLKLAVAIPLTQWVNLAAIVHVMLTTSIEWRGVRYEIRKPYDVELVQDRRPYEGASQRAESVESL